MKFGKLKSIFQLWKPWVRTVDGVQISFATPRSYFVQIGNRRAEVCFDVGKGMAAVINGSLLKTWKEPNENFIDAADKERILRAVVEFMSTAGYKPRIEINDQ